MLYVNEIGFKNALIQKVISNTSAKDARCLVRLSSPISDLCPAACGPAYVWHRWGFLIDPNGQCMGIDTSRIKIHKWHLFLTTTALHLELDLLTPDFT